jgi:hypothetical protein
MRSLAREVTIGAIGQDDAMPYDQRPLLPVGDDAVVPADEPGALGMTRYRPETVSYACSVT